MVGDNQRVASQLQQAWRLHHQGRFGEAFELARQLARWPSRYGQSLGIYTTYLVQDEHEKLANFKKIIALCEGGTNGHA